jgi:phage terminase large subunit
MKVTRIFTDTAEAYTKGKRYIINIGSSRSSKTFSELQLIYIIARHSQKTRIITIVSHSLPHLEGGAIRDFDHILTAEGIPPDSVRTKRPYIYKINKTIIEFVGFDSPGKALGAARDILFINEANKMPFEVCHQLIQRTTECIFIDYNPSSDFWVDDHGYKEKEDAAVIHSTFKDNIENLTTGQIDDFLMAKNKAKEEQLKGVHGYWSNWWTVYGLGLKGSIQGVVFPLVTWVDKFPTDCERIFFGLDFGFTQDPTALVKVGVRGRDIFLEKLVYRPIDNAFTMATVLKPLITERCWADTHPIVNDLQREDIPVYAAKKFPGCIAYRVDIMNRFNIHLIDDPDVRKEQANYKFKEINGKFVNEPDPNSKHNHFFDASGYACQMELRY